jgi:hypothetical protein
MIQWLARERLINMGVQQNTKVAVDSSYLIELMNYEHRTLGVMLAMLEKAGHASVVQEVVDGFIPNDVSKITLHYYEQAKRALGIE